MTPCPIEGGREVCFGDATGLQGLTNTWIEDRQGCLILGELLEKEEQFFVYLEDHLLLPWKQLEGRGGASGEVPGQELNGGPVASVLLCSFWTPLIPRKALMGQNTLGMEFKCLEGLLSV